MFIHYYYSDKIPQTVTTFENVNNHEAAYSTFRDSLSFSRRLNSCWSLTIAISFPVISSLRRVTWLFMVFIFLFISAISSWNTMRLCWKTLPTQHNKNRLWLWHLHPHLSLDEVLAVKVPLSHDRLQQVLLLLQFTLCLSDLLLPVKYLHLLNFDIAHFLLHLWKKENCQRSKRDRIRTLFKHD